MEFLKGISIVEKKRPLFRYLLVVIGVLSLFYIFVIDYDKILVVIFIINIIGLIAQIDRLNFTYKEIQEIKSEYNISI